MNAQTFFILLSSLLALISPIVYARAILRQEAKPHRTTRFVLLLITALSTASLFAHHDRVAIWLAGISTLQAIGIFILSIKYGMGGWGKIDLSCLGIALIGIILWQITNNPALGLYFSILADFTGMIPALLKTYHLPKTEIVTFYALDILASFCTLLALRTYTMADIAYPIYIFAINTCMSLLIIWPRRPSQS